MEHIILTPEQLQLVRQSSGAIEARDHEGRTIGHLTPLSPADLDALDRYRRNKDMPRQGVPSAEVQAHLKRLAEIEQSEGLDEPKMLDLLRRMRAGEKV